MSFGRICLVTAGNLSSDPRLVKEAEALHESGYSVRVIALDPPGPARDLDKSILKQARWRVDTIEWGPRPIHLLRRFRQEVWKTCVNKGIAKKSQCVKALSPLTARLARLAAAEPADLYIGHCLAALPAVVFAARKHGTICGFDAEDDHVGELDDTEDNQADIFIRKSVEEQFLPLCHHLTAAAPGIADAYRNRYGVVMTPILNVFPIALSHPVQLSRSADRPLSLYWFSQTIGPGRGLEQIIAAMGKIRSPLTLSIRGSDFLNYSAHLKQLAARCGVEDAIRFFPSVPPDDLVGLASEYDVGLATELHTPPNHALCLSNKIFTYLLAGIPVLLSNTPAQAKLSSELGTAAQVVDLAKSEDVANALQMWANNKEALTAAKAHAWHLGHTRFNWDYEKKQFLSLVEKVLLCRHSRRA